MRKIRRRLWNRGVRREVFMTIFEIHLVCACIGQIEGRETMFCVEGLGLEYANRCLMRR